MIDRKFLRCLNPCTDGWENYLYHYSGWSGTWSEFFELDKISTEDKLWVFTRNIKAIEKQQREFAFLCAERVVSRLNVPELNEFFTLVLFIYESGQLDLLDADEYRNVNADISRAAYFAAYWSAYCAAYWAADCAEDWAAERETQLEIAKYVMEGKC